MKTETITLPYLETPRRCTRPMKLDRILLRRMKAFLRARERAVGV